MESLQVTAFTDCELNEIIHGLANVHSEMLCPKSINVKISNLIMDRKMQVISNQVCLGSNCEDWSSYMGRSRHD